MLAHKIFYYHTLRKLTVAFGSLFKDIYIERTYENGTVQKHILVPLNYGQKQKYFLRAKQNTYLDKGNVAVTLPRMAFVLDGMTYNPDRKLLSTNYHEKTLSNTKKLAQYFPAPYDVNYSLYVMTDNADDGIQIVEQIVPFFCPEYTTDVNTIPELGIVDSVPVTLNNVNVEDNYDTEFEDKRVVIWTLQFTMQGYIYGPMIDGKSNIIRRVITDLHDVGGTGEITNEEVQKTPRHVRITIDPNPITAGPDDEYTFTTTIEDFDDGKKRNNVTRQDEDIE